MTYYQCDKCKLQSNDHAFIKRLFLDGDDCGPYHDLCADCRDALRAWLATPFGQLQHSEAPEQT